MSVEWTLESGHRDGFLFTLLTRNFQVNSTDYEICEMISRSPFVISTLFITLQQKS